MRVQRESLSRVQQEKKVLSLHTTTNPPSQTCNIGKVCFDFKLEGVEDNSDDNEAIEAKVDKANVTN